MASVPEIRLLGELEVLRAGKVLPLAASKKTRALLGYPARGWIEPCKEDLFDRLAVSARAALQAVGEATSSW